MSPEEVHRLAMEAGLDHERAVVATAIAWAESNLNPGAVGDEDLADHKWGPSIGLWQVRSLRAHLGTGQERDADRLRDPAFNARSMFTISRRGTDWSPWSVFGNGRYERHLEEVRGATQGGAMQGWMPGIIHTPPQSREGLEWVDWAAWKMVWHTTESGYRRNDGGRANYHGHQSYPHFEISEAAIEQYLPITVGAYALAEASETHGIGNAAHAVQAEIVWQAENAANMSEKLLRNIARVLTFVRQQTGLVPHLPRNGFAGPERRNWFPSKEDWYAFEGACGHQHVPGNTDRWDPGHIPAERIVALSNADFGRPMANDVLDLQGRTLLAFVGE